MEEDESQNINAAIDLGSKLISAIFDGESHGTIKTLIDAGAPLWYQDEDGFSALHAACFREDNDLVELLIEKGAIWNCVDSNGNTAADVALSQNNSECYQIVRNAGVRSEFLLHLLRSRNVTPAALTLQAEDSSAAGSTETFLKTPLRYVTDSSGQEMVLARTDDGSEVGVMMGWERDIMHHTVQRLTAPFVGSGDGVNILNVGFGLGIIDGLFQQQPEQLQIKNHVIIEAHPDVLRHMQETGWYSKPNVTILEGKWQDFVEAEQLLGFGGFDIIYTDTFSEDYPALKDFFDQLPNLLTGPTALFSFFNGLGATNPTFYDVYTQVAELHLQEIGLQTQWVDVEVGPSLESRWGETRQYFTLPIYRLPICTLDL